MPGAADSVVIGREAELEAVSDFLEAVPSGGAWLLVEGDPGTGKTTLLRVAEEQGRLRGFRVLASRPGPHDGGLSFSGLGDLLDGVAPEVVSALPEPQRRAFEIALLLRDPEGDPPGPLAVALAVRGALAALAVDSPVLVAVDDAQWLDEPSGAALAHAVRRLEEVPVGVAVVWQAGGAHRAESALLGSARREVTPLRPGPLEPGQLGALLRARLGLSLTAGATARVHRACRGNPLAALEIGRAMVASGEPDLSGPVVPIPRELAGLLRRRLAQLSPDARGVLLVLSAASDPTRSVLESVSGAVAGDALSAAIREGIVEEDGLRVRFTHPLFGSLLYGDAGEDERRRVHGLLADAATEEVDRAMHLALAAAGPDRELASEIEAAAVAAHARGAPSAAADLCEQARLLTPPGSPDEAHRRALLTAEYHLDAGELARARDLLEGLLDSAPGPAARAAALQRLGWVRYHQDSWITAAELFREAAGAAEHAPELSAALELDQAVAALIGGDLAGASSHADAARDRARALDDEALAADASALAASVDFLLGKGMDPATLEQAVEHERWTLPRPTAAKPSVAFGVLLKWSDQLAQSKASLERALRRAREHGADRSLPFILFHLAEVECWLGDWVEAGRHAAEATEAADRTSQEAGRAFGLSARALVEALRGREEAARAAATEGLALASASGAVPAAVGCEWVMGFLELSLGRADRALLHLGPLLDGARAGGIHEPGAARYLADGIEALVAVGDLDTAGALIDELDRRSSDIGRTWGSMAAARCRALAFAAAGDLPAANDAALTALDHCRRLSQPFELARTLLVRGAIERRGRQKRAARESLEAALEQFSGLGADIWVERARAELARIGGRAPSSVELTPTEERVARLVVQGATNQETASALFLSVKTVEWNLSRIYRKLGVRSRTELARWLARDPKHGP
jgi:DNA-binding CsgD family transcriptional regulator